MICQNTIQVSVFTEDAIVKLVPAVFAEILMLPVKVPVSCTLRLIMEFALTAVVKTVMLPPERVALPAVGDTPPGVSTSFLLSCREIPSFFT